MAAGDVEMDAKTLLQSGGSLCPAGKYQSGKQHFELFLGRSNCPMLLCARAKEGAVENHGFYAVSLGQIFKARPEQCVSCRVCLTFTSKLHDFV